MIDKSFQQDVLLLNVGKYDPCLQLKSLISNATQI